MRSKPDPTASEEVRRQGRRHLVIGAVGMATAIWGLWRDIGWIAQPFYAYAWWSYLFVLDGFVALRRGSSLFTTRRRRVLPILVWSVTFWYFFELLNLRFQNWYYVGVFAADSAVDLLGGALFGVICFATVFTGLFQTYEALTALGLFRNVKIRSRTYPPWVSYAIQGVGAVMVTLSLVASHYLSPLVWGSLTFLLDPWNYRRGARSILRDLERGKLDILLRMLTAGLACGIVWESFNFFAPQKWIYTIRGLEELKLFEMPLPGFLGFPALALDAFAAYAAASFWLHGNATWENPADVSQVMEARRSVSARVFAGLLPVHFVFWGFVALSMEQVNIGSVQLELEYLESLPSRCIPALREEGIRRPRQLLSGLQDPDRRAELQVALALSEEEMEDILHETRLLTFKGIGLHHGRLLRRAGIWRVEQLGDADPEALYEKLLHEPRWSRFPALRPGMVRVWVFAARGGR